MLGGGGARARVGDGGPARGGGWGGGEAGAQRRAGGGAPADGLAESTGGTRGVGKGWKKKMEEKKKKENYYNTLLYGPGCGVHSALPIFKP
jgi:hypothetical protein